MNKKTMILQKRSNKEDIWGLPGGAVELGESVEESAIREIKEETGLDVSLEYLVGVYSKYFTECENGDKAQSICYFSKGNVVGGDLQIDNCETFDLKFFSSDKLPNIFVQQHIDAINDFFQDKKVYLDSNKFIDINKFTCKIKIKNRVNGGYI